MRSSIVAAGLERVATLPPELDGRPLGLTAEAVVAARLPALVVQLGAGAALTNVDPEGILNLGKVL